jgi:glutamate-ammonia-ligase adenylyltransferase
MALTRARVVQGPAELTRRIEQIIVQALARPRDPGALLAAVADMRTRMRKEHDRKQGPFEVKHRRGGLIDTEFIVQYLLLATHQGGMGPSWDEAIAGLVAAGALAPEAGRTLAEGHRFWSRLQGALRLTVGDDVAPTELPVGLKGKLAAAAGVSDFAALELRMSHTSSAISRLFHDMIELPAQGVEHTAARA